MSKTHVTDISKMSTVHGVPATPAPKHIAKATVQAPDGPEIPIEDIEAQRAEEGVETIRQYAVDMRDLKDQVKAAEEVLESIIQGWPEYAAVEELEQKLKEAKERLKQRKLADPRYLEQTERVAKVKREQKESKEILSDYLVGYFKKTGERQVLMNDANGDAREVILTGRLGKEVKYQTSLDLSPKEEL
jgi:predicted RNase H-like nuclease (RuvC/YqgF family)